MELRIGKKKLVMFLANVDDILDDDLARLLKKKNPSWTEKECNEIADSLKQFKIQLSDLIVNTIMGSPKESQEEIQKEFEQLKMKFEAFAKQKGITIK